MHTFLFAAVDKESFFIYNKFIYNEYVIRSTFGKGESHAENPVAQV